jgi:hypothetical protein
MRVGVEVGGKRVRRILKWREEIGVEAGSRGKIGRGQITIIIVIVVVPLPLLPITIKIDIIIIIIIVGITIGNPPPKKGQGQILPPTLLSGITLGDSNSCSSSHKMNKVYIHNHIII